MSDQESPSQALEINLGDKGGLLRFTTPQDLQAWSNDELSKWQWLSEISHGMFIFNDHQQLSGRTNKLTNQWIAALTNNQPPNTSLDNLRSLFEQYFGQPIIVNSRSPEGIWILEIKEIRGGTVALGAYLAILNRDLSNVPITPGIIDGMFEAFLYKREIDWSASAHREILNQLTNQYSANLDAQEKRFAELELRNDTLNTRHESILQEKTNDLAALHEEQVAHFQSILKKHEAEIATIERAYDQKLALQKPVKYWQTKESFHTSKARFYGRLSVEIGLLVALILGLFVHETFLNLPQDTDPKHWQVGILVVAMFFAVWLVRIVVRLFLSNHHLATDASERRMMILTYLAMAREGTQFGQEDKTLIVQHIFRSASDGIVKDDGTPPTIIELLTRK